MIDAILITRKITLISGDLQEIVNLSQREREGYLRDPHAEVPAERYLERAIGRMIDINFHIITESGHAPPRDYHDSFLRLGQYGPNSAG